MPSSVQIVPKYANPHEETYINDNTRDPLPEEEVETVEYPYMAVFASSRGIDNKFIKITSSDDYERMYGETNFKRYGQPHLMPQAILSQVDTVAWCMRVMPDDALYANSVLSAWYKTDDVSQKFWIKFTVNQITVDSDESVGEAGMKKILANRDLLIEYANKTDGTPVDGIYQDSEGFTQVPLILFSSLGRGDYGKNLRWRIVADEDYEKEYGIKVYRFQILDVTDGVVIAQQKVGSLISSGKVKGAVLINDIVEEEDESELSAYIHVYEDNFEKFYDAYLEFANQMLEEEPTLNVTIPDVDEFDPFFGMAVKNIRVRVTPKEPFIGFSQPVTADNADPGMIELGELTETEIAVIDDVAGNNFAGGSDGAFATNDVEDLQTEIDKCYLKAFSGKYDKLILAPRRVQALALYDANYSHDVKMQLAKLAMYRCAAPLYLDAGLQGELGGLDINTLEADFSPLDDLVEEFENFEEAWCVSVNAQYYYIRESSTGKKIPVTFTYYLQATDADHRHSLGDNVPRTGEQAILTGHVKNSVKANIAENEGDLKNELYLARINYFEDVGDNNFQRATQSMYVHSASDLLEETNVIGLFRLKRNLEDEFRSKRYEVTTAAKRNEFRDFLLDKYSWMVGTYFATMDIQYRSNAYEQMRNITHCYAAVTFPQYNKITLIEIDINRREVEAEEEE